MRALMAGPQERRAPRVCLPKEGRVRGPYSVALQHSGGRPRAQVERLAFEPHLYLLLHKPAQVI